MFVTYRTSTAVISVVSRNTTSVRMRPSPSQSVVASMTGGVVSTTTFNTALRLAAIPLANPLPTGESTEVD